MNKRILIVDDDRSILDSLSKLLGSEGYEVALADDGQQALEKLAEQPIDLMLLDLGTPMKNGWNTLTWLGQINPPFPVVIITGQCNKQELAEKAGADALMEKPLDVPRLLQTIRDLIKEPLECSSRRAMHRPFGFRYVSCDDDRFRELQNKRFNAPWPPQRSEVER